ncbi:hypothetical protein HANVADRAFT_50923 [Hanseniaspora valbyensis NRRL Y-1626]|uniref:Uncharacterized protein n=1 Tax=Hanseniaspora valbyensis NRRL Y-1626 TaxID=766949 RepID=A0A1B7TJP7_9ASCO|nr:hypothetical protein HANVADRAFT_50923 [Hanseniaspora valbyensis NRRL Y-1626]
MNKCFTKHKVSSSSDSMAQYTHVWPVKQRTETKQQRLSHIIKTCIKFQVLLEKHNDEEKFWIFISAHLEKVYYFKRKPTFLKKTFKNFLISKIPLSEPMQKLFNLCSDIFYINEDGNISSRNRSKKTDNLDSKDNNLEIKIENIEHIETEREETSINDNHQTKVEETTSSIDVKMKESGTYCSEESDNKTVVSRKENGPLLDSSVYYSPPALKSPFDFNYYTIFLTNRKNRSSYTSPIPEQIAENGGNHNNIDDVQLESSYNPLESPLVESSLKNLGDISSTCHYLPQFHYQTHHACNQYTHFLQYKNINDRVEYAFSKK